MQPNHPNGLDQQSQSTPSNDHICVIGPTCLFRVDFKKYPSGMCGFPDARLFISDKALTAEETEFSELCERMNMAPIQDMRACPFDFHVCGVSAMLKLRGRLPLGTQPIAE